MNKTKKLPFLIAGISIASIPVYRMTVFLISNGENNVSTDSFLFLRLIHNILQGDFSWKEIFVYPMINGHLTSIPLLCLVLDAKLFSLNVFPILFLGIFLAAVQVFLIFDAISWRIENPAKYLFLPIFSALVFSPSQISTFEYEITSLMFHWSQLGFFLGIWGIFRFPGRWTGVACACFGGVVATGSHGCGPLVWPIFILGFWSSGFKDFAKFICLILTGVLACTPYLYIHFFSEKLSRNPEIAELLSTNLFKAIGLGFVPGQKSSVVSFFNYPLFFQFLGWPLSPRIASPNALYLRSLGILAAFGMGLFLFLKHTERLLLRQAIPCLLIMGYGLASAYLVSLYRISLLPWYTTAFIPVYLALAGLILLACFGKIRDSRLLTSWSFLSLVMLAYFYFSSPQAFFAHSLYLRYRSPVSASCLRDFRRSPTYCEPTLFWSWGHYPYLLNYFSKLKEMGLSVFSEIQRRTLQGDIILGLVKINEIPKIPDVFWVADQGTGNVSFTDYRHLNLFLHTPNSVEWAVSLPHSLKKAEFHSAISINQSAPKDHSADGVIFEVYLAEENDPYQLVYSNHLSPDQRSWQPFHIPLLPYSGKTLKIKLTSSMIKNANQDWAMYRYPYIDLILSPEASALDLGGKTFRPINTELSESAPKPGQGDYIFDLRDPLNWETRGIKAITGGDSQQDNWILEEKPFFKYKFPLDLLASEYSHIFFRFRTSYEVYPLTPRITLTFNGPPGYQKEIRIPPLSDGNIHEYNYDLGLLELDQNARITGLNIDFPRDPPAQNEIWFSDLRMIKK